MKEIILKLEEYRGLRYRILKDVRAPATVYNHKFGVVVLEEHSIRKHPWWGDEI